RWAPGAGPRPRPIRSIGESHRMAMSKTALHSAIALALAIAAPMAAPVPAAADLLPSFSGVVKATQPAVVTVRIALPPGAARMVHVVPEESDPGGKDFFERFFGRDAPEGHTPEGPVPPGVMPPGEEQTPQGLGSGFIIDPSGVIITNYHVVEESDD